MPDDLPTLPRPWRAIRVLAAHRSGDQLYSRGVLAERVADGTPAFAKVFDFSRGAADLPEDRRRELLEQTFAFERAMLERCRRRGLRGVVRLLAAGRTGAGQTVAGEPVLILERAEGDLEHLLDAALAKPRLLSWRRRLEIIADVAEALGELHAAGMAHQDVKPSNVLLMGDGSVRLADLARGYAPRLVMPHAGFGIVGDRARAPVEQRFGVFAEDRAARGVSCDTYLLGSLIAEVFMRWPMTPLLRDALSPGVPWPRGRGSGYPPWDAATVEMLRAGLVRAGKELVTRLPRTMPRVAREDLIGVVVRACEPDPWERLKVHARGLTPVARRLRRLSRL